jgi:hypothetical protein
MKKKILYPTAEHIINVNQGIVASDIEKIKRELKNPKLTHEEKDYLMRLLKWKQKALKQIWRNPAEDGVRDKLMQEGEIWHKRKDKHFNLDYDVLTD